MSSEIQAILRRTYRPPIGVDILPADIDKHHKPWGFTIYRTCYTPESNQQWKLLINNILKPVLAKLSKYKDRGQDPNALSIISENFTLDARSDPDTLAGLTMDQVSQIHRNEVVYLGRPE